MYTYYNLSPWSRTLICVILEHMIFGWVISSSSSAFLQCYDSETIISTTQTPVSNQTILADDMQMFCEFPGRLGESCRSLLQKKLRGMKNGQSHLRTLECMTWGTVITQGVKRQNGCSSWFYRSGPTLFLVQMRRFVSRFESRLEKSWVYD
ncbi:hypothetical protein OCU04_005153 [Sclerotinia nivalis]|uniref:Uncharacterized protein n=1 Tax=Sclerotinia nivalis TaxID=352851 RepID=A0A9X0DJP0_9HELO|nr:hypothetical protein OCU04_005153 [Sclerotinia nivalis]